MSTPYEPSQQPNPTPEAGDGDPTSGKMSSLLENVTLLDERGALLNGEASSAPHARDGADVNGADLNGLGVSGVEHNGVTPGGIPDDSGADENGPAPVDGVLSGEVLSDEALPELVIPPVPLNAVKIKGRPGGVSLELGEGAWPDLLNLLEERLAAAEGFFRGGRVVLETGARPVLESQLRELRDLLAAHEMKLGIVRSTAERTLQAALEIGLTTSSEETDEVQIVPETRLPDAPPVRPGHFVHRGSLRSGQILRKTESIVIIGDVNPGAQVISGGDIMIWGRLRGVAYAGADGNRKAVVSALDFAPTQLRIANLTSVAPEQKKTRGFWLWKKEPADRAEIARVVDGRIVVEPWDDGRPGGPTVLRR